MTDAYDARAHLASLVGQALETAGRGRSNRILRIERDTVVVTLFNGLHEYRRRALLLGREPS